MSAHEQGGKFPRVQCWACEAVCLPEHAPEYVVHNPTDEHDTKIVNLCRVPTAAAADGLLLFKGCGPEFANAPVRAKLLADPFIGIPAATLRVML